MKKIKCLVTAGPTREFFDPVRFISNPSTGKMGIAIAEAAAKFGWEVSLVLGPTNEFASQNIHTINVVSADDMLTESSKLFADTDILIMTAAVSDMRPKITNAQKVKKDALKMLLEFEQTPDILKTLSQQKTKQILIGFAAETENIKLYASKKLVEKNLDAIAANSVADKNTGFASDNNALILITKSGKEINFPTNSKRELAKDLIKTISQEFFS